MNLLWSYELIWLNCSISYYNWALKSDQINQIERTKKWSIWRIFLCGRGDIPPRFALNMYTLRTNILINAGCTFVLVISVRDALYKWLTSTHAVWVKSTACHVMCNTWVCYLLKKGINNVSLYLAIYIVPSVFIVVYFWFLSSDLF